jgi:hypothetical protein
VATNLRALRRSDFFEALRLSRRFGWHGHRAHANSIVPGTIGANLGFTMKTSSVLAFAAALGAGPVFAFDVPRSAHRADEVDKAVAEATKSNRGLVFVASDSKLKPS